MGVRIVVRSCRVSSPPPPCLNLSARTGAFVLVHVYVSIYCFVLLSFFSTVWDQVYGFDMSVIKEIALTEPLVDVVEGKVRGLLLLLLFLSAREHARTGAYIELGMRFGMNIFFVISLAVCLLLIWRVCARTHRCIH